MTKVLRSLGEGADRLLLAALGVAVLFHGALLATGSFRRTYDAYVHIFFADHYARGWFETWEPRWYTGFTVTSYPPGTHQLVALASKLIGLEFAYALVQLLGIVILVIGVYRFAAMIGSRRAAGMAALLGAVATGIGEAVHVFGQLPTICALGLLLNSLPHAHRWVATGGRRNLTAALGLLAGTTALHHVTTLFGAVFFVGPVIAAAVHERFRTPCPGESPHRPARVSLATFVPLAARRLRRVVSPLARVLAFGPLVVAVLLLVVWPYWVWSSTDPIAQIPIPHASRESFLKDLNAGLVFWLIPWGPMLLALPYALWRGIRSRAWPHAASLALLTLLGTGGTTPIPRLLLGGAYDILTLDRFTLWATVLVLPFAGMLAEDFLGGRLRTRLDSALGGLPVRALVALTIAIVVASAIFTVNLTQLRRMQPDPVDPAPVVDFLEKDQHWQWRYLTLGFGDQMAWLSAQTTAQTVDGNYHSARRLPELVSYPVERLEGAKFRGIPGVGSLQQFLSVPERYHLKFVFSNDSFYDPLLQMSGWRRLNVLDNDVVVWEREDVPPMPALADTPEIGLGYRLLWGIVPLLALVLAAAGVAGARRDPATSPPRRSQTMRHLEALLERAAARAAVEETEQAQLPKRRRRASVRPSVSTFRKMALLTAMTAITAGGFAATGREDPAPAASVIDFYEHLDFRHFQDAWELLDPKTRPTLSEYLLELSIDDGLLDSYASLDAVEILEESVDGDQAVVEVALTYVTPLAEYRMITETSLRRADRRWVLAHTPADREEPAERLARRTAVTFAPMGRRTITTETTEYDDVLDRPELRVSTPRVVFYDGRPSLIGEVANVDADPASLTITARLYDGDGEVAAAYNASQLVEHSLLPGEGTPYRIDFEATPGAADVGTFDPAEFVPIDPIDDLTGADAYYAALVTGRGLARPLVVHDVSVGLTADGSPELSGSLLNLGTTDVTVTALLVSLFDRDGRLVWVDQVMIPEAVQPGLERSFSGTLTPRGRLQPADTSVATVVNGLAQPAIPNTGFLYQLPAESGYAGLSIQPVVFLRSEW